MTSLSIVGIAIRERSLVKEGDLSQKAKYLLNWTKGEGEFHQQSKTEKEKCGFESMSLRSILLPS
jgi:hypothetical protein